MNEYTVYGQNYRHTREVCKFIERLAKFTKIQIKFSYRGDMCYLEYEDFKINFKPMIRPLDYLQYTEEWVNNMLMEMYELESENVKLKKNEKTS